MPARETEETIDTGIVSRRMRKLVQGVSPSVLVVDDDELGLQLIADQLEHYGLHVARAEHGAEALKLLEREEFSVLIADWQMPVMDGIELTERLRAQGQDDLYIIMLTARDSGFDYDRAYAAGVDDYLAKKLPDTELMARIHAAFNTVGLRRELKKARATIVELEAQLGARKR